MNRRNFLKAFTCAAVGAGVLAYAPKITPEYVLNYDQFHKAQALFDHFMRETFVARKAALRESLLTGTYKYVYYSDDYKT